MIAIKTIVFAVFVGMTFCDLLNELVCIIYFFVVFEKCIIKMMPLCGEVQYTFYIRLAMCYSFVLIS